MFPSQKLARRGGDTLGQGHASMGPGCFHPRNTAVRWTRHAWHAMLQWGRDVSIPEMGRGDVLGAGSLAASMGPGCFHPRNELEHQESITAKAAASMGPGCFHPRNLPARMQGSINFGGLQWGRDVSIPEIVDHVAGFGSGFAASMGPGCFHP